MEFFQLVFDTAFDIARDVAGYVLLLFFSRL